MDDDDIVDEMCDETDDVEFKDNATYLRKAVYSAWRRAHGKAVLADIANTAQRYGALKPFKIE